MQIEKMTRRWMIRTTGLAAGAAAMGRGAGATGIPDWGLGPFVRDDGADHIGARAESVFS